MVGPTQTDEGFFAIGTHRDAHRGDVAGAGALEFEVQGVDDLHVTGGDDADAGPQFVGDPQFLAVRRQGKAARALADLDVFDHFAAGRVNHMHHAGHFRGNVHRLAVMGDFDALGLLANLDRCQFLSAGYINDAEFGVILIGHIQGFAVR